MHNPVWCKSLHQLSPLRILGRTLSNPSGLQVFWPLSGIEMMLKCTVLSVEIDAICTNQSPWIALWADGSMIARFPLRHGRHWYPLLSGMDGIAPHRISIVNDTQPMQDNDMALTFCALQSDGQLLPLQDAQWHFEFIGDSLTTGEGCIGPRGGNEWISAWMCPSLGFAHLVSEEMQASASLISQSGWGVYCDWNNDESHNLPAIYDQLCGIKPEGLQPYSFPWKMDAVIINLGTNDISALNNLPEEQKNKRAEQLKHSTAAFLQKIRQYNPEAYLLWVYGMCGQNWMECFREGVDRARTAGDEKIGFCPLPPCTAEETGSRMHPGPENHKKAAQAIVDHLKSILK